MYDKELQLTFLKKIRDERRFAGVDELVDQIKKDRDAADRIAVLPV
ncbi:MAG: riboflavin kinase [Syntrophomonadaceae bacterium]